MIHKFKSAGFNIVLDVNSGGVHVVDDLTYDILDNIEPPFAPSVPEKVLEKLQKFHRREDIWTCYDEIVQLYNEKMIFTEPSECRSCEAAAVPLRALCLNVSHDCNLRCRYCFAENGSFGGERCMMTAETAERAVDFLIENSGDVQTAEIYFFGGEPLMNFEVVKHTVSYARSREKDTGKKFRFSITTNGTLLNDEITDYINSEIDSVILSADGRREINDAVRCRTDGTGIYDDIMPKFRKLVSERNGREYCVRGTFTRRNTDFSEDVFSLADAGFERISIEPVAAGSDPDYTLTEAELPWVFREYDRLARRLADSEREGRKIFFLPFDIDVFGTVCSKKKESGCSCGNSYLAVTPSGDIYPCHQFTGDAEMKMGSIFGGETNAELRNRFAQTTVRNRTECRECWAKFYCSGGCTAAAYHSGGDLMKPHKLTCQLMKKRIECALAVIVSGAECENDVL